MTQSDIWALSDFNAAGYRDVEPGCVALHRKQEKVIDVREPHEFDDALGHVPQAQLVPLREVGMSASHWDPEEPVVVVCRSGGRSARAASLLAGMGFTRVMNVRGGMLAWKDRGLPVERGGLNVGAA